LIRSVGTLMKPSSPAPKTWRLGMDEEWSEWIENPKTGSPPDWLNLNWRCRISTRESPDGFGYEALVKSWDWEVLEDESDIEFFSLPKKLLQKKTLEEML